jgi:aminomethyltransferase
MFSMVKTTPFHPRVSASNQTQLWSHWSNFLVAEKYQMSEKFEYFAVRNAAGLFDTSPLYKYRIAGADAERFLSRVLARDIRRCRPGGAQYTMWCDDRGHVIEDGVVFRRSGGEFLLTAARPNLAYLQGLIGYQRVEVEDVSTKLAALAVQGPSSREILGGLAAGLGYFQHAEGKLGQVSVMISRTGYTGDLGFELWVDPQDALEVWDAVTEAGAGRGLAPFGQIALLMTRIEAGLLLLGTDYESSRYAWTDEQRASPIELGYGWMLRDIEDRPFIGKRAIVAELSGNTTRWRTVGIEVGWRSYDEAHRAAGLLPPKDHVPARSEMMLYDEDLNHAGFTTSFMYSPILQRHIALARVLPPLASSGNRLRLELTIDHRYRLVEASVVRLPFFNPARRRA